jgi:uracil-DNA glycosylase family 4
MVFGQGAVHAPLMRIGEQPGDKEDLQERPFVGRILDAATLTSPMP